MESLDLSFLLSKLKDSLNNSFEYQQEEWDKKYADMVKIIDPVIATCDMMNEIERFSHQNPCEAQAGIFLGTLGRYLQGLRRSLGAENTEPFWAMLVDSAEAMRYDLEPYEDDPKITAKDLLWKAAAARLTQEFNISAKMMERVKGQAPSLKQAGNIFLAFLLMAEDWQIQKLILSLEDAPYGYRLYALKPQYSTNKTLNKTDNPEANLLAALKRQLGNERSPLSQHVGIVPLYSNVARTVPARVYYWHFDKADDASNAEAKLRHLGIFAEAGIEICPERNFETYDTVVWEDMNEWATKNYKAE